jgi:hypothetical protein
MNAWLMGDFRMTKIFVIAFLVDFAIRIVINPGTCRGAPPGTRVDRRTAKAFRLGGRVRTGGGHVTASGDIPGPGRLQDHGGAVARRLRMTARGVAG